MTFRIAYWDEMLVFYYERPWEITADVFGDVVSRTHLQSDIIRGFWYLGVAIGFFPACYLFL